MLNIRWNRYSFNNLSNAKLKTIFYIFIVFLLCQTTFAQIGGESTFQFLSLSNSARTSALSNSGLAIWNQDLNLALSNPSLLDSSMHKHFALNYTNYIADINYGMAAYSQNFKSIGTFAFGINYLHYGDFDETDLTGQKIGSFSASDYAFNLIYSKALLKELQIGFNLKFIYSNYYQFFSSGIALDGGITYHNDQKNQSLALVFSNLGHQIKPYREGNFEKLPFDVQLAFAQKLKHAPFRFLIGLHHLHYWKMAFESPLDKTDNTFASEPNKKSGFDQFGDEALRHINVGAEIVPGKNFYLRVGYNFQRYKEMAIKDKFGMLGFSFGLGLRIYKFHISYAHSICHVAGSTNTFSITSNLQNFY